MNWRLRTYDELPPGMFRYSAIEGGISVNLGASPMIEAVGRQLSEFRKANNLPRSGLQESVADVDAYTCQRLGGMSKYCVPAGDPKVALSTVSPVVTPCRGCGARV